MHQYIFLSVNPEFSEQFDIARLRAAIETLPGLVRCEEPDPYGTMLATYFFDLGTDDQGIRIEPAKVDILKDGRAVSITASLGTLQFAPRIQSAYGDEIFATTEQLRPDSVRLSTLTTATPLDLDKALFPLDHQVNPRLTPDDASESD